MWIEVLDTFYTEDLKIKKKSILGFLVTEPENLKKKTEKEKDLPKTGNKHGRRTGKKRSRKRGGFLSRYGFAYAGRDVVNQAGKIAPGIIKQATGEIEKIAQSRINEVIKSGGLKLNVHFPK